MNASALALQTGVSNPAACQALCSANSQCQVR